MGDEVKSIGIFMGGADPSALSEPALRACREHAGFTGPIELVTTQANPRHSALKALAARWPQTTVSVDIPELSGFYSRHGLQIGAGGSASLGFAANVLGGHAVVKRIFEAQGYSFKGTVGRKRA